MAYDIRRVFQKMAQGARSRRSAQALTAGMDLPKKEVANLAKTISREGVPSQVDLEKMLRSKGYEPGNTALFRNATFNERMRKIRHPDVWNWNDQFMQTPDRAAERAATLFEDQHFRKLPKSSRPALLDMIRRRQLPALDAWDRQMTSGRHGAPNILEVPSVGRIDPRTSYYRSPLETGSGLSAYGTAGDIDSSGNRKFRSRVSDLNWFGLAGTTPGIGDKFNREGYAPFAATQRPTVAMQQAADAAGPGRRERGQRGRPQQLVAIPHQPGPGTSHPSAKLTENVIEGWKVAVMSPNAAKELPVYEKAVSDLGGEVQRDGSIVWEDAHDPSFSGLEEERLMETPEGRRELARRANLANNRQAAEEFLAGFHQGQSYVRRAQGSVNVGDFSPGFLEKKSPRELKAIFGGVQRHGAEKALEQTRKDVRALDALGHTTDTRGIPKEQLRLLGGSDVMGRVPGSSLQDRLPDASVTLTPGEHSIDRRNLRVLKNLPSGRGYQQTSGPTVSIDEHGITAGAGDPRKTDSPRQLGRHLEAGRRRPRNVRPPKRKGRGGKGRGAGAGVGLFMLFNELQRARERAKQRDALRR